MTQFEPSPMPNGRQTINGAEYMQDAKGALVPVALIKPQHVLQDEVVRKIIGHAMALSSQVARFKAHTFDDIGGFEALLEQEYGSTIGGAKGNKTLMTHDGLYKVQVQVADYIDFGPELQTAKGLIDECLNEWAAGARDELRAIVTRAFNTDSFADADRLPIDQNHATDLAAPKGMPSPASGWIVEMQARADGIWGRVEWTREGAVMVIYAGSLVCRNAAGFLVKGATALNLTGVGRAEHRVDNSAGAAGDAQLRYRPGIYRFVNSAAGDLITIADIGKACFVVDDQTVAKTSATNTRSKAGVVDAVDDQGVWVRMDEALARVAS